MAFSPDELFAHADVLDQRNVGRADKGAGSTFDAGMAGEPFCFFPVLAFDGLNDFRRFQLHGAGVDAASAMDAGAGFDILSKRRFGIEDKDCTGPFSNGVIEAQRGKAHHHPAGNELARSAFESAGSQFHGIAVECAQAADVVARFIDAVTADGRDALI